MRESSGIRGLWETYWDFLPALLPPPPTLSLGEAQQQHGDRDAEDIGDDDEFVRNMEEESKNAEEDFINNSTMDGPQSSADLLLSSQPHQPPLFPQQKIHGISPPPLSPGCPSSQL